MQRTFVRHMAATGDATYAATKAGYAAPELQGWRNMQIEAVRESVMETQVRRIQDDLVVKALDALEEVMTDKTQPAPARNVASGKILDAALKLREGGGSGKELHEMSLAEVVAERRRIEAERMVYERRQAEMEGRLEDAEIEPEEEAEPVAPIGAFG